MTYDLESRSLDPLCAASEAQRQHRTASFVPIAGLTDGLMRWGLWLTVVLVLLLAAYMVWPLTGFYRIASAIEAKDATALAERVEFRSLRRSLTQQVIAEYFKLTGKDKKLGQFRTGIATGVGAALADPVVAQFLTPEALLDFLTNSSAKDGPQVSAEVAPFSTSSWRNAWRVWWHSEYGITKF